MQSIYNKIRQSKTKQLAILIDPDKQNNESLHELVHLSEAGKVDFFMVGGSLLHESIENVIQIIKELSNIPVLIFPGSLMQISSQSDGILLLSLISGRNPDFLIGNHVVAAPFLKKSGLEIISTAYMLIESGQTTSVEYMSNTKPIPSNKPDIASSTALAGEMLGLSLVYLDAGSGAQQSVPSILIREVKKTISIPLIVGGGLHSLDTVRDACEAGADILVVGTATEHNPDQIKQFAELVHGFFTNY